MAAELILDANLGLTNIIGEKEVNSIMVDTFTQIKDELSDHCGPYSKFAMLSDLTNPTNVVIHTKDGINIVRHMHYASPMQEFIRKTLMYIGDKAEKTAGDATTASMIMTASAMEFLLQSEVLDNYTYSEIVHQFDIFLNNISINIDKNKYTIDGLVELLSDQEITKAEVIKFVSHSQAYTSSHGDKTLSNIIGDIFSIMPEETWNYIGCQRSRFETDTKLSIDWDNSQYSMDAEIFNDKALNKMSGTQYGVESADLIVFPYQISGNFFPLQTFKQYMSEYKNDKDLIIVLPNAADSSFYMELDNYAKLNNRITVFQYYNSHGTIPNLEGLSLVCGFKKEYLSEKLVLVHDVKCEFKYKRLYFNNLYEDMEDGIIHPEAKNGYLKKVLDEIEKEIEIMSTEITGMESSKTVEMLKKYYLKLLLVKRPTITIGGNSHDNSILVDIVKDTLCAVCATLKHGFTFTQNVTLYGVLQNIKTDLPSDNSRDLHKILIEAFEHAISAYRNCLFKHRKVKDSFNKKFNKDGVLFDFFLSVEANETIREYIKEFSITDFVKKQFQDDGYLIIQPGNVDAQLISRFGEVALKFLKSNKILVPNSVMMNK